MHDHALSILSGNTHHINIVIPGAFYSQVATLLALPWSYKSQITDACFTLIGALFMILLAAGI